MLANFLKARYSLGVETSTRHDLWLHSSKVSGSSARIVKDKAYHHCTLLCSAEITSMRQVLASCFVPLTSNSTKSVRSNVKNLFDTFDTNDFITLLDNFIVYLKGFGFSEDVIQIFDDSALCLKEETDKLASWDWVYGQTPEFSTLLPFYDPFCSLEMKINKGVVTSVSPPDEESVEVVQFSRKVESKLKNSRFDFDLLTKVLTLPEFNQ
ncbi:Lipoyltransferase 1, mitochondrial [Thelohanellus kitauei]|uniref:Lipoyltransferase 1, mitochondrial n=1 Tax=Thelohanellus kitauei TaxID=669202 RepID=A0A0C2J642_THEKT|nr:Lipoyltransferase 1, mitochondrial [Thelohanellus kitauei]